MMQPIRTIIVDDEPLARIRLRTLLAEHADFLMIAECGDGPEALTAIAEQRPDLVFLDVQMVEMDGVEVARAIERSAEAGPAPAVVFVTAFDRYALDAFSVHAVDYLLKPFDEERFVNTLQRVRALRANADTREAHAKLLGVLRDLGRGDLPVQGTGTPAGGTLRLPGLEVDLRARTVRCDGSPVSLRPKEFDLLVALLKRAGEAVSRGDLLQEVWGYSQDVASRTIDTHVSELRRKLARAPGQPGHVTTVARTGYRLEA